MSNLAGSLCQGGVFLFFNFLRQSFFTFFNAALNADHSKEASLLIAGEDDAVEEGNLNTGLGKKIGGTCTLACVNRVGLSVGNDADRTARCQGGKLCARGRTISGDNGALRADLSQQVINIGCSRPCGSGNTIDIDHVLLSAANKNGLPITHSFME